VKVASVSAIAAWALLAAASAAAPVAAQDAGGPDAAGLAKQLTNPISSLVSVPFQFNYDSGLGTGDGQRTTLNMQPVVPCP
jgi:hypothetical protein